MKLTPYSLSLIALVLCSLPLTAQEKGAVRVSQPVPAYVIDVDLRDLPKVPAWLPGMPVRDVPRSSGNNPATDYRKPGRPDALAGSGPRGIADPNFSTPSRNFSGQPFTGSYPADPTGDVGRFLYLQATNSLQGSQYIFYSKLDNSVVAGPFTLDMLAGPGACATGLGDPSILYDHQANRWLIAEYASDKTAICMYISQTSDPITGGWFAYSFATEETAYNQIGLWRNAYLVNGNDLAGGLQAPKVRALERDAMLAGDAVTVITVDIGVLGGFSAQAATPATLEGTTLPPEGSAGIFMRHRDDELHNMAPDGANDFLEVMELTLDFDNPETPILNTTDIAVTEFDSGICFGQPLLCFEQPEKGIKLDVVHANIMPPLSYRNFGTHESLVGCYTVDADGADTGGIRWFELRRTPVRGVGWTLHQEGTYAPADGVNRWIGAIGMDGQGNMALGFNVVNATGVYPGLRYTGRLSGHPAGTMAEPETTVVAGAGTNNSNRYGDYNGMAVDPDDDCTFWFTGNYNDTFQWSTRIASFKFSACGCDLEAPALTVEPNKNGPDTVLNWTAVPDAERYTLYRASGACPQSSYRVVAEDITDLTFTDTSIDTSGTFSYLVRAYDDDNACFSEYSNCAEVQVTPITVHDDFVCRIILEWAPDISMNVYRSETPGFTPNVSNRVAECNTSSYFDTDIVEGTTYYYVLRPLRSIVTPGRDATGSPCTGEEAEGAYTISAIAGRDRVRRLYDFETNEQGFTASAGPGEGGAAWALTDSGTDGNGTSFFTANEGFNKDQVLLSGPIEVTADLRLSFLHKYNTEIYWDGNVLEYSTDAGVTWFDILAGNDDDIANNDQRLSNHRYNTTLEQSSNELRRRRAWTGDSGGFVQTNVDLTDMAGKTLLLRWRHASDGGGTAAGTPGWWVDNITQFQVNQCVCEALSQEMVLWPNQDVRDLIMVQQAKTCP